MQAKNQLDWWVILMKEWKVARKFDRQARLYAKQREQNAMAFYRKKLIPYAHGKVLELAVGAGANFAYYKAGVHVTAVDISPKMLEKAKEGATEAGVQATFQLGNAETMSFPHETFDTVVSTLSFCGYEDPLHMFAQVSRWCKRGGTILLMEHGISSHAFIATLQKWLDPCTKKIIGCHQNRDMMNLIENSPLELVHCENYLKGMLHLVRARPKSRNFYYESDCVRIERIICNESHSPKDK